MWLCKLVVDDQNSYIITLIHNKEEQLMLKSKKALSLNQKEAEGFGLWVKNCRKYNGLSINEIAARIGEDPVYVENVESGNVSVGIKDAIDFSEAIGIDINMLLFPYQNDSNKEASADNNDEALNHEDDNEDAFMNEKSVKRAIEIISECSDAECSYIVKMIPFVYDACADGVANSVTLDYDDDEQYSDVESCMSFIYSYFHEVTARDRVFLVSAIELSLAQIRAGMGFTYIPFPSAEINPQMLLMAEAMDFHYSCDCSSCEA